MTFANPQIATRTPAAKAHDKRKAEKAVIVPFEIISLKQILVDQSLQTREQLYPEWLKVLADALQLGELTPIKVIRNPDATPKNHKPAYILVVGFHRFDVYQKAGRLDIRAYVIDADRQEAILESIKSNTEGAVKRLTDDDYKKAVFAMLADPELRKWSDIRIAEITRIPGKSQKVKSIRLEAGYPLPKTVELVRPGGNVVQMPYKKNLYNPTFHVNNLGNGRRSFYASIPDVSGSKTRFCLGSDEATAREKFLEILSEPRRFLENSRVSLKKVGGFREWMATRGILIQFGRRGPKNASEYLPDFSCGDWIGMLVDLQNQCLSRKYAAAYGVLDVARKDSASILRSVIIRYLPEAGYEAEGTTRTIRIVESLGIHFMTPEEFANLILSERAAADQLTVK
jgi:hypothetical protein